jgi:regulator of replication initiation timing
MKSTIYIIISIVLVLGLAVTGYFLYDFSTKNKDLTENLTQLSQQLEETKEELASSEDVVDSLTDEVDSLIKDTAELSLDNDKLTTYLNELQSEFDDLTLNYDELAQFTFCGDEFVELEMNYRSNQKASEALADWVEEMWGGVIGAYWLDTWSPDTPGYHLVETGYTTNQFIVYFEQQDFFDAPNGVFMISHHCWLDGGPDS